MKNWLPLEMFALSDEAFLCRMIAVAYYHIRPIGVVVEYVCAVLAKHTTIRMSIALVLVALIYLGEVFAPGSEIRLFKETAIFDCFMNLIV